VLFSVESGIGRHECFKGCGKKIRVRTSSSELRKVEYWSYKAQITIVASHVHIRIGEPRPLPHNSIALHGYNPSVVQFFDGTITSFPKITDPKLAEVVQGSSCGETRVRPWFLPRVGTLVQAY